MKSKKWWVSFAYLSGKLSFGNNVMVYDRAVFMTEKRMDKISEIIKKEQGFKEITLINCFPLGNDRKGVK